VARRRAQWRKYQGRLDPSRLVFIDETWVKTNMTRTHGRAPKGQRLLAKAPHGRWRTLTFLAALRRDRIDAPCVIDGPINGQSFLAYVEQVLVPVPVTSVASDVVDGARSEQRIIGRVIVTTNRKREPHARKFFSPEFWGVFPA